jgi:hypothetical protein
MKSALRASKKSALASAAKSDDEGGSLQKRKRLPLGKKRRVLRDDDDDDDDDGGGKGTRIRANAAAKQAASAADARLWNVAVDEGVVRNDALVLLGLPKDVRPTADSVNRAFRHKVRKSHPDQGGSRTVFDSFTAAKGTILDWIDPDA